MISSIFLYEQKLHVFPIGLRAHAKTPQIVDMSLIILMRHKMGKKLVENPQNHATEVKAAKYTFLLIL